MRALLALVTGALVWLSWWAWLAEPAAVAPSPAPVQPSAHTPPFSSAPPAMPSAPASLPPAALPAPVVPPSAQGEAFFAIGRDGRLLLEANTGARIGQVLADDAADGTSDASRLAEGLPPRQAADARALIAAYRTYMDAGAELLASAGASDDPATTEARYARLKALRVELFGHSDALRLFGAEEEQLSTQQGGAPAR